MGCTIRLQTSDCFYDHWKMCRGVYWATDSIEWNNNKAWIVMSRIAGTCPSGTRRRIRYRETAIFNEFTVKLIGLTEGSATIEVWRTSELSDPEPDPYEYPDIPWDGIPDPEPDPEPITTKPQILTVRLDKTVYNVGATYNVGDIIKSECTVKNIGGSGIIYLKVGLGYLDSSDMIFLTGAPIDDQLFLNYQQFYTFKEDIKVDITDYYRQRGIGWAYLQQQMYLFFLAGHRENGEIFWDTEKHIKIYIDEPEEFKDPTDIDESIIGDIDDIVKDIIPDIGDITPDAGAVIDWMVDKLTPKMPEEDKEFNWMPFIYMGYVGIIIYMLIGSR